MASLFTSEDFRKSVDAHVKRFEQIETQHKANLARQVELQKHTIETLRAALQAEQEAWKLTQQSHVEAQEKWEKEKQKVKEQHAVRDASLTQQSQELHRRETQLAAQEKELSRRHTDMLAKEAQLRETAERLAQERREIQTKLGKLKDIVA